MELSKDKFEEIKNFALNLRKKILTTALSAGASSSHFGGSLSTVEIISTLYSCVMKFKNEGPLSSERDRFILSKGHGCLGYYAALSEIGLIKEEDLKSFEKSGSDLLGHPVINRKIGIEFSNGSLGMGLSLGIGVALAIKKRKLKNKIYVLIGDGECNEGSIWESAMAAPNFELDNICAIIDHNNFQQTGSNKEIMKLGDLKSKWESFGWNVIDIDGHDILKIFEALIKNFDNKKPKMIIANTIKGKGFDFSENNNNWHHAVLTQKQYDSALEELLK